VCVHFVDSSTLNSPRVGVNSRTGMEFVVDSVAVSEIAYDQMKIAQSMKLTAERIEWVITCLLIL